MWNQLAGLTNGAGLPSVLAAAPAQAGAAGEAGGHAAHQMSFVAGPTAAVAVVFIPLLATVLVTLCAVFKVKSKLPAWITVGGLVASFGFAVSMFLWSTAPATAGATGIVKAFDWINLSWGPGVGQTLTANFSFYVDTLTCLWMLFVTGLAAIIALYASEYMSHDVGTGYCRFFAAFNLFVFSMACLVMGDNLLLLFLGWEGVGLCSYLLIGYFYKKAPAVAAAKKAFIVNRIGDLGLSLGLMLAFVVFGTVEYRPMFEMIESGRTASGADLSTHWANWLIPGLLMIGAFGKSAQVFFYVWLPDAMEGPTPVSALIHAATMVTAGVFLIARQYPLFTADPDLVVLSVVAWCGAITALWAATIEMAIFDIKRVMGYSTISQLGFMFAGLGLLTPTGAAFHTFTHAFFKATLFLGVGAVMHGFGGQLDLRRLSGVMWMRGFGLVGVAMLIGSINLSGVPFTAGYFSKDMILAQGFANPAGVIAGGQWVAWILLLTAGMTAYYTFRTYLRVYVGPKEFRPGDDAELLDLGRHPKGTSLDEWHAQHGHGHGHGHDHGHGHAHGHGHDDHSASGHGAGSVAERRLKAREDFDPSTEEFDPHPPGLAMKVAIATAMLLSIAAAGLYFLKGAPGSEHGGWVGGMIHTSSAAFESPHGGLLFGQDPHKLMYYVSAGVGFLGILIACFLHGPKGIWSLFIGNRTQAEKSRADALINVFGPLTKAARNKYYVDEIYHAVIVTPLRIVSHVFHAIDKILVDGLVNFTGWVPKGMGKAARDTQTGVLHDYALRMGMGVCLFVVLAWLLKGGAL